MPEKGRDIRTKKEEASAICAEARAVHVRVIRRAAKEGTAAGGLGGRDLHQGRLKVPDTAVFRCDRDRHYVSGVIPFVPGRGELYNTSENIRPVTGDTVDAPGNELSDLPFSIDSPDDHL
jgi:hypothetical protein